MSDAPLAGLVLAIEASGGEASVAVLRDGVVLAEGEAPMRQGRGEALLPCVTEACARAGIAPTDLARLVVGAGPGGFTPLRIAAATAKGIAHPAGLPVLAVPSLLLVAAESAPAGIDRVEVAADALRGESYVQAAARDADGWRPDGPVRLAADVPVGALVGRPRARAVRACAPSAFAAVDLAGWEPSYGRLAEAQVRWEADHGRPLPAPPVEIR